MRRIWKILNVCLCPFSRNVLFFFVVEHQHFKGSSWSFTKSRIFVIFSVLIFQLVSKNSTIWVWGFNAIKQVLFFSVVFIVLVFNKFCFLLVKISSASFYLAFFSVSVIFLEYARIFLLLLLCRLVACFSNVERGVVFLFFSVRIFVYVQTRKRAPARKIFV